METGYERQTYPRRGELRENRGVSRRIIEQEGGPQPRSTIFVFSPGPNQYQWRIADRSGPKELSCHNVMGNRSVAGLRRGFYGQGAQKSRHRAAGGGGSPEKLVHSGKKQVYILGLGFQAGFYNDHWVVGPLSKTMRARRSSLEGVIGRGR